jgi:hypothetical protein
LVCGKAGSIQGTGLVFGRLPGQTQRAPSGPAKSTESRLCNPDAVSFSFLRDRVSLAESSSLAVEKIPPYLQVDGGFSGGIIRQSKTQGLT